MMELVINTCYGGFGLSEEALAMLKTDDEYSLKRNDPALVKCVKDLGDKANDRCSELKVVTIPDGVDFIITEYDGWEGVVVRHRVWH